MCVCSLSYPARNAHAFCYITVFSLSGSTIFLNIISQNGTTFGKIVTEHKRCFDFLYKFCLENFSFEEEFSEIQGDQKL
jgi:hypothetical protein